MKLSRTDFLFLTMLFTLSKKERIKSKKLFEQLFEEGKSVSNFPIKLFYLPTSFEEDDVALKIAVVAPKRNFKSAVDRNRIKRLMREAYRLNKHLVFNKIEGNFAFVFLYLGKEMPDYQLIENKMTGVLQKFIKKTNHEKVE